uniref:CHY-type domain-containing protein n=1 Tax=Globisporangium ultimum (strain ATCC 200006 / CBS 805.95 / DAOM BR144) TaxID=431595 RepID=K3W784_GLOUD
MMSDTTSQQQTATAGLQDALQKEWAAVQRRYHAQRIAAQDEDKATRLRCFVSLSDPDLPEQFKGETELLIELPAKYPDEEPVFDLQHYKSRLTAAQFDAIEVAMRQRAKELCGTLSLRKLLTWLDNKFYPLMISTGEVVTSEDAGVAETQQDQVEVPDASSAAANTGESLTATTPETTLGEQQHTDEKTKQKKDTSRKSCRFFLRQSCKNGDNCKFSHAIKNPKTPKPETTAAETVDTATNSDAERRKKNASVATNQKHSKEKEDKVSSPSPVESKPKKTKKPRPCKFFARNKCRDGEKCKFLHEPNTKENADQDTEAEKQHKSRGIVIKVLKASVEATEKEELDDATASATEKRASSEEWSESQQKALDEALKKYPATIDKKIRWISIASEVNGKSLNECIDRFKYLCQIVRDEQPASAVTESIKAKETEEEEAHAAMDKRIIVSDGRVSIQTEPEVTGSQIRLEDLFLHQIGTLIPHRLVCQVQCNNCPLKFDAKLGLDSASIRKWCPRCSVLHLVSLRPVFAHAGSSILAYVDTNENCGVVDVVPSELLATCLECGNEVLFPSVTPGRRSEHACFSCHTKLALMIKRYVVGHVSSTATSCGKANASSSPQLSPKSKQKQGGAKKVVENFVLGQPLPQKGACEHYKHSFRWFRFQCCGKAFPCDVCHDSSDCPQANMGKIASRMICGLCSKEQSSAIKECSCGNKVGRKKIVTSYWEGGMGCRDSNMMSQNDKKKFRGLNKTESTKHKRVGVDAKKHREQQQQNGATNAAH